MKFWPIKSKSAPVEEKAGLADPEEWLLEIFGLFPAAGNVYVSNKTAMNVPAVSAAVHTIADTVGTLPAKLFVRGEKGKEPDPEHPAHALVHSEANDWTSAAAFRTQLTRDALLNGNGFAFANRVNGSVVELTRLDPTKVSIEVDEASGEPSYLYKPSSERQRRYSYRDVLHIPAFTFDGVTGQAPVKLAQEAIATAMLLERHEKKLFENGARPSGVLSYPDKLGKKGTDNLRESFEQNHGGSQNSGKAVVLAGGAKFIPITFNSVDAEFHAAREFAIVEIARAFNVPVQFLNNLDRATWSNSEQMNRQFLQFTLLPWLRTWEAAYRRVLLTKDERASHTIEFIVDDLLRADTATRFEAYAKARASGTMTSNEVRARENLPALDGGNELNNPFTDTGGNPDGA